MGRNFLLEIGLEEAPSKDAVLGISQLRSRAEVFVSENRLTYRTQVAAGTPRRLVLYLGDLAQAQADLVEEVKGPPRAAAFDQNQPTAAARGFARSQGVALEDLVLKDTSNGEYLFATKTVRGQKTEKILPGLVTRLIGELSFPKSMRWDGPFRFIRPIRWVLALFGSDVIDLSVGGLASGRRTFGHRFLAPGPFEVDEADWTAYLKTLRKAQVVVKEDEREKTIRVKAEQAVAKVGGRAVLEPDVLSEVIFLVEYPSVLLGSFGREYLKLPREVLEVTMGHHQRYFPVEDEQGLLAPYYLVVHNGSPSQRELIRKGHNRVIAARLADARFFYEEDRKVPLAKRVDDLRGMVFQSGLGTLYDKAKRLRALTGVIAEGLKKPARAAKEARRAAFLCKADLTTEMVGEFPELQGVMGQEYAKLDGEGPDVAAAIYEHYLPRGAGDDLAETELGMIVSVADKLDTLVGSFGAGRVPTGSEDPYALRRQAQGLINTVLSGEWRISLNSLMEKAFRLYGNQGHKLKLNLTEMRKRLAEFLEARLKGAFQGRGLEQDIVEAILARGLDDPMDAAERGDALVEAREDSALGSLLVPFNRCHNLARAEAGQKVAKRLLEDHAEKILWQELEECRTELGRLLRRRDYEGALKRLAQLRPIVDDFFDEVLVMAEDDALKQNRLALLNRSVALYGEVADFTKLSQE